MGATPISAHEFVHPGARWWKVDFHAHSPASFDFGAEEGKRAVAPPTYRSWLLAYMDSGIDALVITDHNTHEGIDKAREELAALREENAEGYRELFLFSGIEFTVDGGYHLLGVFDVDTPSEEINGLLYLCKYTAERGSSLGTTKMSFAQVVEEIVSKGGLAIPAHADAAKGLFTHDLRNQADIEASKHVVAVEVVSDEGASKAAERGWIRVLGSDAHHLDAVGCPEGIEAKYPGSHFTWIKMEEPNLFGIRLALSDGEQSVVPATEGAKDQNAVSHSVIERVVLRKGEAEAAYSFGPWMNTVIGGRGVGKSTIIEIVRLVMGRFSDLPNELQSDGEWFSPLPGRTASSRFWDRDTKIEVHLARLGRQYRVLWHGGMPEGPTIEVLDDGEWREEGGTPRDRFALLINSQKQIYETARDPQSLLKALDDQSSIAYVAWKETFDELCGQYRTERSAIGELQTKIATRSRLQGELADILAELEQIAEIRDSPEARELDQLILEEQQSARSESVALELERRAVLLVEDYSEIHPTGESGEVEAPISEIWAAEITRQSSVVREYGAIKAATEALIVSRETWESEESTSPRRQRIEQLTLQLHPDENRDEETSSGPHEDPNEANARLTTAKGERETALADIGKSKTKLERLSVGSSETLEKIRQHRAELTKRRIQLAELLSGDDLKIQILAQADDASLDIELRNLVQKTSSFDPVFGESGLPIVLGHPFKPGRDKRVKELKNLLKELCSVGADSPILKAFSAMTIDTRFYSHLKSLDEHTFHTEVDLWFPEDRPRVRYRRDGSSSLSEIDQGSPGEKTAALLAVVLQLSNDPLLLDQPEDDLDNKLIYDLVVTTLKRIKVKRQVIVVTHNANVVVNADAEHVTILRHGLVPEVEAQGSIQMEEIKKSICLIMEGGAPAFEARYKRLIG
ncbi:ATPase involved in DNA repair [Leifsonia rubra CMS 76R]|nr:ATPase involved in DNA repair [Leifsonia rubra CMS 76R]